MNRKHMRRGLVLILVLIVIAMLSLGAYAFTDLMLAHHEAAIVTGQQAQARALVDSGVKRSACSWHCPRSRALDAGGMFDNSDHFRGVAVIARRRPEATAAASASSRPSLDSDGKLNGLRHGLEDESTRLNLNVLLTSTSKCPAPAARC